MVNVRAGACALTAAALSVFAGSARAGVVYVDASAPAGGDGSSWASALRSLQAGLEASASGDEVRVAQGVYRPGPAGSRLATFRMRAGVAIRGGYAGLAGEDPDARDIEQTPSVLSGDLAGNDGGGEASLVEDNAFNVVTAGLLVGDGALLDGFVVTGGVADGAGDNGRGGGMLALGGPVVRGVTFTGNRARSGGGVYVRNALREIVFEGCVFDKNTATGADGAGGGMLADCLSLVTLNGCVFAWNEAFAGGGLAVGQGVLRADGCTFATNFSTGGDGGGVLHRTIVPGSRFERCWFVGNTSGRDGGGACVELTRPRFVSCFFSGNSAVRSAGGLGEAGLPLPGFELLNSTIVGNKAGESGGGVMASSNADLANCIVWDNEASEGAQVAGGPDVSFSLVEGGSGGPGNSGADPLFFGAAGPDGQYGTGDDDPTLLPGSAALDAGTNAALLDAFDRDIFGNARRADDPDAPNAGSGDSPVVDIGCYERQAPTLKRWISLAESGAFEEGSNWSPAGAPTPSDTVVLDLGLVTTWVFARSTTSDGVEVEDGSGLRVFAPGLSWSLARAVTLDEGDLEVEAGLVRAPGFAAIGRTLRATKGGAIESVADAPIVVGAGGRLEALEYGLVGAERIEIEAGGALRTARLEIAPSSAPSRGVGSVVRTRILKLALGASVEPLDELVAAGGRIDLDIGSGAALPALTAQSVELFGGALAIRQDPGFAPPAGTLLTLIDSVGAAGAFDIALLPGFPDNRYYRVVYEDGLRGGQGVFLVVEASGTSVGFDPSTPAPLAGASPTDVVVADFNDDDLLDVAASLPSGDASVGSVQVLLNAGNDGGGAWLGFGNSVQVTAGVDPSALAAADFDGDGDMDFAVANRADDTVQVFLADPNGGGPGVPLFAPGATLATADGPVDLKAGNYGGGPETDLLVVCKDAGLLQIFEDVGTSRGTTQATDLETGGDPTSVDDGDVDNDKDIDAVVAGGPAGSPVGSTTIIRKTESGYVAEAGPATGGAPRAIALTSLDGGMSPDIVTANSGGSSITTSFNNGDGSFQNPSNLPVGDMPRSLTDFDADGDGDMDLVVVVDEPTGVRGGGAIVRLLRNTSSAPGNAVFDAPEDILTGASTVVVASGDVNGDGLADVIAVNAADGGAERGTSGGSVIVLLNQSRPGNPSDLTGDGVVDALDLAMVLGAWGPCPGAPNPCLADLTGDGKVNSDDLCELLGAWTDTLPPE